MKKNRLLTLIDKQLVGANSLRLVFAGDDLADFPEDQASGYVKLMFAAEPGGEIDPSQLENAAYFKALRKRTFTIRQYDAEQKRLTVDGACHSFGEPDQGPANQWLQQAELGDQIWVAGPGEKKLINTPADWYFFAGDMTALPAIAVNLEQLPQEACGYAVIEVLDFADIAPLARPDNIAIHWVVNGAPKSANTLLSDAVRELPWLEGTPAVWVAGEFEMMRNLRAYFKKEQQVPKSLVYASSYWKIGESDEGNKVAKRLDEKAEEQS
ncbi:siderophore-interacting protein [Halioxenophilus sp. WMMB6]|uniref:siderophore-interacting protein n=1 Tax=Halioxenophilus sp. WMMB6 TaxID=3073815 RepID=UPI00295EBAE2|nr:siderophore-interacting protein [Halioxenophilus sp. WMMB6]